MLVYHFSLLTRIRPRAAATTLIALLFVATFAAAQLENFEGAARGFPALRDLNGKTLAAGDFAQWLEKDRLHVKIVYEFNDGRRIEEMAVVRQRPQLVQEKWSWRELSKGKVNRQFEVDLLSGKATAKKIEKKKDDDEKNFSQWSEDLKVEPGRTFAGIGVVFAIKRFRETLVKGDKVELQAVVFTPKPRMVGVEISYVGLEEMRMAGRVLRGDHFLVHPKIPWIVDLFINVPDVNIWLTPPHPAAFLRVEGPIAEPADPVVRIDLLPGGASEPARPVKNKQRLD